MNALPSHAARRNLLRSLLAALLLATALPAVLGWRLIAAYAALPQFRATLQEAIAFETPEIPTPAAGRGVAVAPDGAIFVTDSSSGRLLAFPDGTQRSRLVVAAGAEGQPLRGQGLALSPDGALFLLDEATGRVHVFNRGGEHLRSLSLASPGARCLAIDRGGNIYVGDTGVELVRKYLPGGDPDLSWGDPSSPGSVRLPEVSSLAAAGGHVYAATPRGLHVLDDHGRVAPSRSLMGSVTALAAGSNGDIYASDVSTNRVWVYSSDGRILGRVVAALGRGDLFFEPRGLAVSRNGRLYVVNGAGIGIYTLEAPSR